MAQLHDRYMMMMMKLPSRFRVSALHRTGPKLAPTWQITRLFLRLYSFENVVINCVDRLYAFHVQRYVDL
jgi:hypothetical protein